MSSETIRVVRRFQASAERVYDAWFNPSLARRFLFATESGEMQKVLIDREGFTIIERRAGEDFQHVGRYLALDRPRLISFAFAAGICGQELSAETTVRIELTPLGSGSELTLAHEGVPLDFVEQGERSWATILANLDHSLRPDT